MKILLMGDASNYHYTLSCALRSMGHDVTVASNGSGWMDTSRHIDLYRRKGKLGGALLWLKLNTVLAEKLKGYDVVQICSPVFLELRPHRVKAIFERLRKGNGLVFLSSLATDSQYVEMCMSKSSPLRYNEFKVGDNDTPYAVSHEYIIDDWLGRNLSDHCKYIYENVDGAISALYEYHLCGLRHFTPSRLAYGGIPIDTSKITFGSIRTDHPITIMVACHKGREAEKGVDRMLPVIREFVKDYSSLAQLDIVQNLPFDEFRKKLQTADIVVDQLYSYTPATTALMAMAAGKIVVSGAEPEFYDFLGEEKLKPIINVNPLDTDSLYSELMRVVMDKELLKAYSVQGRQFVEKHNDMNVVAQRFVDFWESIGC